MTEDGQKYLYLDYTNRNFEQFLNCQQSRLWYFIWPKKKLNKKLNTDCLATIFNKACVYIYVCVCVCIYIYIYIYKTTH